MAFCDAENSMPLHLMLDRYSVRVNNLFAYVIDCELLCLVSDQTVNKLCKKQIETEKNKRSDTPRRRRARVKIKINPRAISSSENTKINILLGFLTCQASAPVMAKADLTTK